MSGRPNLRPVEPTPEPKHRPGHVPPHNLEAEEALLGAMLLKADAVAVAGGLLTPTDFYTPAHATIFDAILRVAEDGPVDPITVADHLKRHGQLDQIGGPGTLVNLQAICPATSNAARYATIVHEHATCRRMIVLGDQLTELGWGGRDPAGAVEEARAELDKLAGRAARRSRLHSLEDLAEAHIDVLESREASPEDIGIPSGWRDLDDLIGRLRPGQLVTVAGRPGMGKSVMGLCLSLWPAIKDGKRVLFVSLEMPTEELTDRLFSAVSGVNLSKVREGDLDAADWQRISKALPKLIEAKVTVLDDPQATVAAVHAAALRLRADLVVVDYLQIVKPGRAADKRADEVSAIAYGLKVMARDLGVPVVALAQLSRAVESRMDKRPVLSDLKESGGIEEASDVVIGLYRDDYYNPKDSKTPGRVEAIVLKQRNGPTGVAELAFLGHRSLIADLDKVR